MPTSTWTFHGCQSQIHVQASTLTGMDPLDAALGTVRVESLVVGRSLVTPPWGLVLEAGDPCVLAAAVRSDMWVRHGDAEPFLLEEGAVVVACGGVPLVVGDRPDAEPTVRISDQDTCRDIATGENLAEVDRVGSRTWGDPAAPGSVLLGAYTAEGELYGLLDRDLPPSIVIPPDPLVAPVLAAVVAETESAHPGQTVVVDRLMELLLFAAIRAWLASPGASVPSWATALGDPVVGPALQAMHDEPARAWTVASLASEASVSRAAFARRFRDRVGEPPLAHLTRWRMALAADLLRAEPALDLAGVAARVGYADPFGFSTAFRRVRGTSPSAHRRSA